MEGRDPMKIRHATHDDIPLLAEFNHQLQEDEAIAFWLTLGFRQQTISFRLEPPGPK